MMVYALERNVIKMLILIVSVSVSCKSESFQTTQQNILRTNRNNNNNNDNLLTTLNTSSWSSSESSKSISKVNNDTTPVMSSRQLLEGMGSPSSPGWQRERLNRLTEWAGSRETNRPIICEYEPNDMWLWTRWRGTILQMTWKPVLFSMAAGLLVDLLARNILSTSINQNWGFFTVPPEPFISKFAGLKKLWEYQLSIATFIVTFFLSHAYSYWQKVYDKTRMIQGRINDFCLLLSIAAKRHRDCDSHLPNAHTHRHTEEVQLLLNKVTRLIRMSHTFFWAAMPTASNGITDSEEFLKNAELTNNSNPLPVDDEDEHTHEHIGPILLSPHGLKALANTGQLTKDESEALMTCNLPPNQYGYILLAWVGIYVTEGLQKGLLIGGHGFEENILRQLTSLRSSMIDIDDLRAGRMPLAYVQLVQILVDSLILLAPISLYSELGSITTFCVGLLTFFYRGLLTLSKSFLDPFGVEGFGEQNIRVDVLVSELNFGASKRWIIAGNVLPPNGDKP